MTMVRSLDSNKDWLFGKGKNDYKNDLNAISQNISTRLNEFLGDCFWNISAGIDWFNLLGSKQKLSLEIAVSTIILNTPEVTGLAEVFISLDTNRSILIQYSVNTIYGVASGSTTQGV